MPKGSDLLVAALANEGVKRIFTVPGEENLDVVESLRSSEIELILIAVVGVIASLIVLLLGRLFFGFILLAALASTLLAQRSLYAHVADVAAALEHDGLEAGRKTVARIVGRDPEVAASRDLHAAGQREPIDRADDGLEGPADRRQIAPRGRGRS